MPTWVKVASVLAVLGLLAATNLGARERQRRADARTSDVVSAAVVVTADAASLQPGSVELLISVSNSGGPLQLRRPRVEAAGFTLDPLGRLPARAGTETTVLLRVRLRAVCRGELEVPPRLVVPVVPRSGRVHDVAAGVAPDLGQLVCGLPDPAAAAQPEVGDVRLERYAVAFRLSIRNTSARPFTLTDLRGQGLALSARGGLPAEIPARQSQAFQVRLAIPSCAQLPDPLDAQRIDSLRFAALELELADVAGRPSALPFLPDSDTDLYLAIRLLARQICPRGVF